MNKGILYIVLSGLMFLIVNVFVKSLGAGSDALLSDLQKYPVHEIVLFRSIISLIISYAIIKRKKLPVFGVNKKWLIIRGICGVTALTSFFYTINHLPIAIAVTVQYLSPVFTVLFTFLFLKEKVSKKQWIFSFIALLGVFIIGISKYLSTNTELSKIEPVWVGLGIFSALSAGVAYLAIIKCKETDSPINVVIYFPMVAFPIMLFMCFFEFVVPVGIEWIVLLIIGVFTQFAQIFMTKALHYGPAATVMPFKYLGSVYALMVGMFIFGEFISFYAYLGITVVLIGILGNTMLKKPIKLKRSR
ncbi:DMT family transporter [Lishizhenia sp.]|uniref:DMT family transporter n=1 Tax=Lishizhenia sp. TaxID=2497594 RepID=UPI00299D4740|nr:DMT family transporter [Lishizhenia sp.]MDX1444856.1 DMT family transporter [Lishizhenia sp.]